MFKKLHDWYYKREIELENKLKAVEALGKSMILALESERDAVKVERDALQAQIDNKVKKESTIPWFQLETDGADPVKGLQVNMDWNEAFIQHLREAGHTGRSEELLIQKWLAMLYEDIIEQLEQALISINTQNNDKSEFE